MIAHVAIYVFVVGCILWMAWKLHRLDRCRDQHLAGPPERERLP